MKFPKIIKIKKADHKPNVTVYMSIYYIDEQKFKDLEPMHILPNDTILATHTSMKPITLYSKVVFDDTGTIHNLTPTNIRFNEQYQVTATRSVNLVNCETRKGKRHEVMLV